MRRRCQRSASHRRRWSAQTGPRQGAVHWPGQTPLKLGVRTSRQTSSDGGANAACRHIPLEQTNVSQRTPLDTWCAKEEHTMAIKDVEGIDDHGAGEDAKESQGEWQEEQPDTDGRFT